MEKKTIITKKPIIFTVGHSTHSIDEFIEMIKSHGVKRIIDVRTIPKSRYNPQFNEETLKDSLNETNINYKHMGELGGLRHSKKDSINLGWRNKSFRGYADYMATADFDKGLEALMKTAHIKPTAIMCAEAVPWRCHRSLIGDVLTKKRWQVYDILSPTKALKHRLTPFLKIKNGQLIYPEPKK